MKKLLQHIFSKWNFYIPLLGILQILIIFFILYYGNPKQYFLSTVFTLLILTYAFSAIKYLYSSTRYHKFEYLESGIESYIVVDKNLNVIFSNQLAKKILPQATKGNNLIFALPESLVLLFKKHIEEAFSGKIVRQNITFSGVLKKAVLWAVKSENKPIKEVVIYIKDVVEVRNHFELIEQNSRLSNQKKELKKQIDDLQIAKDKMLLLQEQIKDKESNLSGLMDSTDNFMLSVDFRYKILNLNRAFQNYFEQKNIKISKGKNIIKTLPAEDIDHRKKYIDKALEGNKFKMIEEFTNTKGEPGFMEVSYNPIWNNETENIVIGVAIFMQDISKYKLGELEKQDLIEALEEKAQNLQDKEEKLRISLDELQKTQKELITKNKELIEKEARIRSVIDNSNNSILAIDKNYNLTIFNLTLQKRYEKVGVSVQIGTNVFSLVNREQIPHWKVACDRALKGESFTVIDKIGSKFFEVSLNPIYDKTTVIGASILISDVHRNQEKGEEDYEKVNMIQKIQEKIEQLNSDKNAEIDDYRKKVEALKKDLDHRKPSP